MKMETWLKIEKNERNDEKLRKDEKNDENYDKNDKCKNENERKEAIELENKRLENNEEIKVSKSVSKSGKILEMIDEKTPKSKFKLLKKNFQEKIEENMKSSKNSDFSMSNPHFSNRESKKGLRCATLTPSSGNLRGESAENRVLDQFLMFRDSDNNKSNIKSDNNGKLERSHGKRKLSQNIKESIFEDHHFSPKKVPKLDENFGQKSIFDSRSGTCPGKGEHLTFRRKRSRLGSKTAKNGQF